MRWGLLDVVVCVNWDPGKYYSGWAVLSGKVSGWLPRALRGEDAVADRSRGMVGGMRIRCFAHLLLRGMSGRIGDSM